MIFTHKQYSNARCNYSSFYKLIDSLILTHTFIFLGCAIDDPDIELTLENEINKKIDALFDGRIDEIRHRKENIETNAKVADLEMRVDNLEKIIKAS